MSLDPRLTPAREDLAAARLRGVVDAPCFVEPVRREVIAPVAPVRKAPSPDAMLDTEALRGELVDVYDTDEEGWAWGQLVRDGYVGYLPADALVAPRGAPTHAVAVSRTLVFPGPSIKLPPRETLSLGAVVRVTGSAGALAILDDGGHVPAAHLVPAGTRAATDFVAIAEGFLGTPYLWGGKSGAGLDCSGLVQVAMHAAGLACPRDSDMQEQAVGSPIPPDPATFVRGDLVFWPGHVAIVSGAGRLLHANAHHMMVTDEPLDGAIARIARSGTQVRSVRRVGGGA